MGVPLLETPSDSAIALSRHGLVEYQKAWESQRAIHQDVVDGKRPNTLLLLGFNCKSPRIGLPPANEVIVVFISLLFSVTISPFESTYV